MKTLALIASLTLGPGPVLVAPVNNVSTLNVQGAVTSGSCTTPGDGVVLDANGVVGCQRLTDSAPQGVLIRPQVAYPAGTQTAARVVVAAGQDETKCAIDGADPSVTCAGDNDSITLAIINSNGTSTSTALTEGTEWTASASVATTCASLAAAVDAVTGVTASCTSPNVLISLDTDTAGVVLTESTAGCTTVSTGTAGITYLTGKVQVGLGTGGTDLLIGPTYGLSMTSATLGTTATLFQTAGDIAVSAAASAFRLDTATSYIKQWGGAAYDLSLTRVAAGIWGVYTGTTATKIGDLSYVCNTASGLNTSSTNLQTIYTVPASKTLWVDKFVARDASAAITVATVTFGCEGGGAATNIVSSAATLALTQDTEYLVIPASVGAVECAAAAVVSMDTVAQEGAADTITVEMCGWIR